MRVEAWFTKLCDRCGILRGRIVAHVVTHDQEKVYYWRLRADGRKESIAEIPWVYIRKVIAYQIDLLTYDELAVQLQLGDGRNVIIDEDACGYKQLMTALPQYLQGCLKWEEIWQQVAFPAFSANEMVLYPREEAT